MNFGEFIRDERQRHRLSLRSLAQRTAVNPAYLSRVEVGKVSPSGQMIRRLSKVLSCDEDELLLLAGRLPAELRAMIEKEPRRVTSALRKLGELAVAESSAAYSGPVLAARGETPIEDGFPFEEISDVAEAESWRKEVYRPVYHIHKWWAQRLGSVFRAAILAAAVPKGSSIMEMFYRPVVFLDSWSSIRSWAAAPPWARPTSWDAPPSGGTSIRSPIDRPGGIGAD